MKNFDGVRLSKFKNVRFEWADPKGMDRHYTEKQLLTQSRLIGLYEK